MRLLQRDGDGNFSLVEYTRDTPPYATLSHTWGRDEEEVTYKDIMKGTGRNKLGYNKIRFCANQAAKDGLQHCWVDTCCIKKSSDSELSEAINSMFRWYKHAARCYVYLSDVSSSNCDEANDNELSRGWKMSFKKSRWFTRGWTLQELLAPRSVQFFSKDEQRLGDKHSLEVTLHEITGIDIAAFQGRHLSEFSVHTRLKWAEKRQTKREEDEAYSLLGIFSIHIPLLYGEGRQNAMSRLRKEIKACSDDEPLSLDKQRQMLLNSLRFDMHARQRTIKNAHSRTCAWLLEQSEYLDWLDDSKLDQHHGFLWIKGKPGTGKSTIMKFALANASNTMKKDIVISFFFNARGQDLEKSTIGTYRSLLLQLLERLPALQCIFDSLKLSTKAMIEYHEWSIESLQTLLGETIQRLGSSSVVCFIDALDECEDWQVRHMISFFEHVGEVAIRTSVKFKVCLSSRHYPHITIRKHQDLILDQQIGHKEDISNYLMSELKIGNSRLAEEIRAEVHERSSGIFMWVILVVGILNREYDGGRVHALRQRLEEIPTDLYELFYDILTRDTLNKAELVLCIQLILFAKRPLSPEELYVALLSGSAPGALSAWDLKQNTGEVMKRYILNSSKGLAELTVSSNPTVQFIHESVRDFFLGGTELEKIWPGLGSNFQGRSHDQIKHCCLSYVKMTIPAEFGSWAIMNSAIPYFQQYTLEYVLDHAEAAAGFGIAQYDFVKTFPFKLWNGSQTQLAPKDTEGAQLEHVLAMRNMPNLLENLLDIRGFDVNSKDGRGRTTLWWAAAQGHTEIVKLLLDQGNANDSMDKHGRTPLSWAAMKGHKGVVQLMIAESNFGIDARDSHGWTPLSWAATFGHETIVRMFLATGKVNVSSRDLNGRTPRWWAHTNGHKTVVRLLESHTSISL